MSLYPHLYEKVKTHIPYLTKIIKKSHLKLWKWNL